MALSGSTSSEQSYIVRQGKLRWEVDPLSYNDETVEAFYNYQSSSGTANPPVDIVKEPAASQMFIYEGPVGSSLVFLHGSSQAESGGTAFFKLSGLSRSKGEWAVRDDTMGFDDDFEKWEGGNAKVKWEWSAGHTDGGAFWGVGDSSSTIKVTPKTLRGVDAWRFLSGEPSNTRGFELADQKPVSIRPADGKRQVKRANIKIMPGTNPNEFDPYAKDRILVAIRSPPKNADASEWVTPSDVDPGNFSVNFGSRSYLAGGNGASPQKYFRKDGTLFLEYKTKTANFTLDSADGFLVGKTGSYTWFRGSDTVQPGGFNNAETDVPLVVTDLNANPEGGDKANLAKEYVEFKNDGQTALDLTGHTVVDTEGWEFHLPDGFTLQAGEKFRLHTGDGQWDENDLYWDVTHPVWDNDGDTITVTDESGTTVLRHRYPAQ
ncbi:lamin tail domain-containing protein [Halospeciosus flavus]|uniref:Lamin tail domain-containing protein n=2 Tax=Halospeciosus flavus TaxID=3032283 RepID=A0ABD5Z671_9EURY|nr:lamin tail domain-containing protein [Halospeciosus flavus]